MRPDPAPHPLCRTNAPRRRPVRVFPTTPGAIPVHPFAAALRTLLDVPGASSHATLAAHSGVPPRTVYRILHHIDRSVTFEVADALLVALDAHDLWHSPPLDAYLTPPSRHARLIHPMTIHQASARDRALARRAHALHDANQPGGAA